MKYYSQGFLGWKEDHFPSDKLIADYLEYICYALEQMGATTYSISGPAWIEIPDQPNYHQSHGWIMYGESDDLVDCVPFYTGPNAGRKWRQL